MKRKQKRIENLENKRSALGSRPGGEAANSVSLSGKISRVHQLRYTPSGLPICEFTLAVGQTYFDKRSVGYFEAQVLGELAEDCARMLKVGTSTRISGQLWTRAYRDQQGIRRTEVKVLVSSIDGNQLVNKEKRHEKI